ncbi:C-type lectin domain family 4 member G-like isoform X1 [Mya arenaria]|uniref:C-type lectin domain family 4 member G-like isoform X1 n=1 Tax=Mya arenaria TaxID=6604 RepID=UPI0022E50C6F|nr:C-type lectin domain family 4 member G-like isoform X1 [Mya arenaria]
MMGLVRLFTVILLAAAGAANANCPTNIAGDDLVPFGSSCYQFILNQPSSWYTAEEDCVAKGGHQVAINNFMEHSFVWNHLQNIGGQGDHGIWLGLTDHDGTEGNWHWADNTPLGFSNWAPGQPGVVGGLEDCVMMEFKDGLWHDYVCEGFSFWSEKHGWVCEFPSV